MPTIKDVAKHANVSLSTVSKYLNKPDTLTPEYRKRVHDSIKALNYHPNVLAQSMRTKKTKMIALIVPQLINHHAIDLYEALLSVCGPLDYSIIIYSTNETLEGVKKALQFVRTGSFDGIIFAYIDDQEDSLRLIEETGTHIPSVIMSCLTRDINMDCIAINIYDGMYKIVEHLIEIGHKKIAFCGSSRDSIHLHEKESAFRNCMNMNGLQIPENYILFGNTKLISSYENTNKLLRLDNPPTAIVATDDLLAIGCVKAIRNNGYCVPKDIAVTGFDGITLSAIYDPTITTLVQPVHKMGTLAMNMLIEKIEKRNNKNQVMMFNGSLSIRHSTDSNAPIIINH